MGQKYLKKCSTSLVIREMQIKHLRFFLISVQNAKDHSTKLQATVHAREDVGREEHYFIAGRLPSS